MTLLLDVASPWVVAVALAVVARRLWRGGRTNIAVVVAIMSLIPFVWGALSGYWYFVGSHDPFFTGTTG